LRIARREAMRSKGRSILMLVMIALPVLGVTAADVIIATQNVNSVESLDRRLGTEAAAMVYTTEDPGVNRVRQGIDPDSGGYSVASGAAVPAPSLATMLAALGHHRAATEVVMTYPGVRTRRGVVSVDATQLQVTDPLAHGLFRLTHGRWPRNANEVVVNQALADRGPSVGHELSLSEYASLDARTGADLTRKVVGIAESTSQRSQPQLVGLPGSIPALHGQQVDRSWLIGGRAVPWSAVQKLNRIGVLVVSRSVILHPNAAARAAQVALGGRQKVDHSVLTIAVLVVVMALIEVVLLAGPAFAVGARRQARPLAVLAASGGTPQQARRVVLATGVVIGTAGALAGVVVGIGSARLFEPILQRFNPDWFGPFQIQWLHLAGVALFGLVSALLAAVVPAWIASRQDVVAVLAGRRGDRKPSPRSPYVGLVLLAVGIGLAVVGAKQSQLGTAIAIAASAICCVLGMLFLVPVVVVGVARLGRFLPLPLRFAVRDAARHRTRTTPAVAAVAASVMGVVALGIGVSSSTAGDRAKYEPSLPMGMSAVSSNVGPGNPVPWAQYAKAVTREAPGVLTEPIIGLPYEEHNGTTINVTFAGLDGVQLQSTSFGPSLGADVFVYGGTLPKVFTRPGGLDAAAAARTLDAGGVIVFADHPVGRSRVVVRAELTPPGRDGSSAPPAPVVTKRTVPALIVRSGARTSGTAIIPPGLARQLDVHPTTIELVTDGPTITKDQEKNLSERLNGLTPGGSVYVERGYQTPSSTWILQLVLACLGALLMLGGTLTATFLALSDARPDLATLSAVGAAPRTRRAVAAAYALAVGGVGAVLGAAVGFVPGIAVTYPLAAANPHSCFQPGCPPVHAHFLDVPWLMVGGVVVLLPLLVSAVVWV
ncbi:MAG: transporter permease, partial [Marmoricola sp.]|nr:transporter permease [Marmoricola sp.]